MNENNKWHVDSPIKMQLDTDFTCMVIYKDVNEDKNWDAQYCDADAQKKGVLNIGIGRTSIQVMNATDSVSETTKDVVAFILTPISVSYEKEIYKPGKVEVRMHVTDGNRTLYASQLRKLFIGRGITMNIVTWVGALKKHISIAKYYYIYSLSLTQTAADTTTATLVCYSPDHKMTLDKYCQVYSGKRFAGEIVKEGVEKTFKTAPVGCPLSCDINDLVFLSYDTTKKTIGALCDKPATEGVRDEMLQPYLMQYNESFYNFICRTAHQCGEFLYYEDGTLHVGLPLATRKAMVEKPVGLPVLTPYSVTYPELTEGMSRAKLSIRNSLLPRNERNLRPFTEKDIPKVDLKKNSHQIVASFSDFASQGSSTEAILIPLITTSYTLGTTINDAAKMGLRRTQLQCYQAFKQNPLPLNAENTATSTMLNDIYANLCEQFYQQIAENEMIATDARITMDFDDTMPDIRLADAVTLKDELSEAYIITSMKGELSLDRHHHTVEALPRLEKDKALTLARGIGDCFAAWLPPTGAKTREYPSTINAMEAIVTDNADPFRLGRVRVTYLWQGGEVSMEPTGWIDVLTPFSGREGHTGGMYMMPDIGAHVMVHFAEEKPGDSMTLPLSQRKYPYIVGSLYTDKKEAPGFEWEYDKVQAVSTAYLPTTHVQTIQSSGGHGITFVDEPDNHFFTEVMIPPINAMLTAANYTNGIDSIPDFKSSGGGMVLHDASGLYAIEMNSTKRAIDIKSPLGTVSLSAFTGITIDAKNGDIEITGKNVKISAGNNLTLESGTNTITSRNQRIDKTIPEALSQFAVEKLTPVILASIKTKGDFNPAFLDISKATDMSFLRASWEVIMRPVEGTLSIISSRNVTMTAGDGKTVIPAHLLARPDEQPAKGVLQDMLGDESKQRGVNIHDVILKTVTLLDNFNRAVIDTFSYALIQIKNIQDNVSDIVDQLSKSKVQQAINSNAKETEKLKELFFTGEKVKTCQSVFEDTILKNSKHLDDIAIEDGGAGKVLNKVAESYNECIKIVESLKKLQESSAEKLNTIIQKSNHLDVAISLTGSEMFPTGVVSFGSEELFEDNSQLSILQPNDEIQQTVRLAFSNILQKLDKYYEIPVKYNGDNWEAFIDGVKLKDIRDGVLKTIGKGVGGGALKALHVDVARNLINSNGCAGPRAFCDVTTGGSILMSDSQQYTYRMNQDGNGFEVQENSRMPSLKHFLKSVTNIDVAGQLPLDPEALWFKDKFKGRFLE